MCLNTKWKCPKKAKRDIYVWKLMYNELKDDPFREEKLIDQYTGVVYHREHTYDLNKTYTQRLGKSGCIVEEGFHAFQTLTSAKWCTFKKDVIVRCVIPKGAMYYKGNESDIVSNKIRIPKNRKEYYV